jgi:hypothetical protein
VYWEPPSARLELRLTVARKRQARVLLSWKQWASLVGGEWLSKVPALLVAALPEVVERSGLEMRF